MMRFSWFVLAVLLAVASDQDSIASSLCRMDSRAVNVPLASSPSPPRPWRLGLLDNMNNPVVLSFGDGTAFFVGVTAALLAILLLLRFRTRRAAALLITVALIGIVAAIISRNPPRT
jgi:hypothetical protein